MKNFAKIILSFLAGISISSCNKNSIEGNGNVKSEVRNISEFNKIGVSGYFDVEVKSGEKQKVEITTDENIIPYIETKVESNKLLIGLKKVSSLNSKNGIKLKITNPFIKGLEVSGAANTKITNLKNDEFLLEVSGLGNVLLKGETKKLDLETSGSGNIEAEELSSGDVKISMSGLSKVIVNAKDKLNINATGLGKITYIGNPKITQNVSVGVKITKK